MENEYLQKFSTSVTWNGIFYLSHKTLSTICTMLFFKMLPTATFSLWANSMSILFLTVLWLDCGLRKTLPQYAPEFAHSQETWHWFVTAITKCYSILLLVIVPPWYFFMKPFLTVYTPLVAVLLVIESLSALLRLIFHSHFWHKEFNRIHTAAMMITTAAQMSAVMFIDTHNPILFAVIVSMQLCGSIGVLCFALGTLPGLLSKQHYQVYQEAEELLKRKRLSKEFGTHAGIMWTTTIGKSITERNMLVPLFTVIFGAQHANIFKVGQDGALLLHRIIVKTIGTTDTSLLAHAYTKGEDFLVQQVFQKITTKIATLCLPLSGILLALLVKKELFFYDPIVFHIFYLVITCYLIESSLSIYERVLEVRRAYGALYIAYFPYVMVMGVCIFFNIFSSIGLVRSIFVIQGVRLVSLLFMTYWACAFYHVSVSRITCTTLVGVIFPLVCYYFISSVYGI